eukprot:7998802-Pyramimonas_sp.AAC.1
MNITVFCVFVSQHSSEIITHCSVLSRCRIAPAPRPRPASAGALRDYVSGPQVDPRRLLGPWRRKLRRGRSQLA